jgi:hypothetical protein
MSHRYDLGEVVYIEEGVGRVIGVQIYAICGVRREEYDVQVPDGVRRYTRQHLEWMAQQRAGAA